MTDPSFKEFAGIATSLDTADASAGKRIADEEKGIIQNGSVKQKQVNGNKEKKNSANQMDAMQQEN